MNDVNPPLDSVFQLDDTPERDTRAQLVYGDDGEVLIVNSGRAWRFDGSTRRVLEHLLPLADGSRTVLEICAALGYGERPEPVLQVLGLLHGSVLKNRTQRGRSNDLVMGGAIKAGAVRVAVLGNGSLGAAIAAGLPDGGNIDCRLYDPRSFASCLDLGFQLDLLVSTPAEEEDGVEAQPHNGQVIEVMTLDELRSIFETHDIVVCALEGMRYRAILDVNQMALETGRPCVMVTVDGSDVVVGPTVIRGRTACFACSLFSTLFPEDAQPARSAGQLPLLSSRRLADPSLQRDVVRQIRNEIAGIALSPPSALGSFVLRMSSLGDNRFTPVTALSDCPFCARVEVDENPGMVERRTAVSLSLMADSRSDSTLRGTTATTDAPYRTIGILGGGTAGYMAAIALRTQRPELSITLIESSKIPIIGVGEATTPRLLEFLHVRSGLDIVDFYRRVLPTWKIGIKFFWGLPGDYSFSGAFQFASLLEPMFYNGNIDDYSLGCALMANDKVPVFDNGDGTFTSYLHRVPFAYHLDNVRFVRYLQQEAARLGVRQLDRVIKDAEVSADGEEITSLIDDGGERHRFDLYIDASGFRSFLLEQKLGSKFISFGSSLFTDSAVAAEVPHNGVIRPYTAAVTMDHGWCWSIPFEDAEHRGYVFSSAFCSLDEALEEMQRKNPGMSKPWSVKFKSGRHEHFWRGNVLAVGNAYGFVEPLESTGLEMLSIEVDLLVEHFPASRSDRAVKQALNNKLNAMWDDLRGLLAIHYKFNRRLDTPFWRECRASTNLASAEARVALFTERAPLTDANSLLRSNDPASGFFSQNYIYDVLLCGMQVPARYLKPFESREDLNRRQRHYRECVRWAIPQAVALRMLREQPETLRTIFGNNESWSRLRRF